MWIIYIPNTFACKYFYIKYIIECRYLHVKMLFHNTLSLPTNLTSLCSSNLRKHPSSVPVWGMVFLSVLLSLILCMKMQVSAFFLLIQFCLCLQMLIRVFNEVLSTAFYQDMKVDGCLCLVFFPNVMSCSENLWCTTAHKRRKAKSQLFAVDAASVLCNPTYILFCSSLDVSKCFLRVQVPARALQRSPGSLQASSCLVFKLGLWDAAEMLWLRNVFIWVGRWALSGC